MPQLALGLSTLGEVSMPEAGSWPWAPQALGSPLHQQEAGNPEVGLGLGWGGGEGSAPGQGGQRFPIAGVSPPLPPTPSQDKVPTVHPRLQPWLSLLSRRQEQPEQVKAAIEAHCSFSGSLVSYTRELSTTKDKSQLQKSHSSQDLLAPGLGTPWIGSHGQLFLLLQYQATAHRIKVLVCKAENLRSLGRLPGHREHSVVIGLYQAGQLLDSRETRAVVGCNPVWNTPFLFSLPEDLHEPSLFLQFTVMQRHLLTRTLTLGWVQIGPEAPAAGRAHWWNVCQHSLQESSQWHHLCPGKPNPLRAAASGSGTRHS
ncbi:uncharacterized protein [Petaurus breviceps papuanus]|uniref:uncharacterized protein n=1 Tax=Petaurus breviceps papuanus TaxID=3040969 RepID=UPI0036DA16D0